MTFTSAAPAVVLTYCSGSASSPTDPFGQNTLELRGDGVATLENLFHGDRTVWTGVISPSTVDELGQVLEQAAFPKVPPHRIPAGSSLREVTLSAKGETLSTAIAWHAPHEVAEMAQYKHLFEILDSLVYQVSESTMQATSNFLPGLVSETKKIYPPTQTSSALPPSIK